MNDEVDLSKNVIEEDEDTMLAQIRLALCCRETDAQFKYQALLNPQTCSLNQASSIHLGTSILSGGSPQAVSQVKKN